MPILPSFTFYTTTSDSMSYGGTLTKGKGMGVHECSPGKIPGLPVLLCHTGIL